VPSPPNRSGQPAAVLFDRDGTLVQDVPYNGDPTAVRPMPGARAALGLLRAAGIKIGVVSNQSGVGRGLLSEEQVARVNQRVEELLGPFEVWQICPHTPADGCGCRKPAPGLIIAAARHLGVSVRDVVVIGDIGADIEAAAAAGADAVLVPTAATLPDETAAAPVVARDLVEAANIVLRRRREAGR
jgi:D-glycero-D-manno-heptose 1,7-bisphosphate phosphatase